VLIAAVLSLVETGPGDLSLDHALGTTRTGPVWPLGALATGVAATALAMAAGSRGAASPGAHLRQYGRPGGARRHRRGPLHTGDAEQL
jgi:hypothetical protein